MTAIPIMVNGLPGNVARLMAQAVLTQDDFRLLPYSLTGPEIDADQIPVGDTIVQLIRPDQRSTVASALASESQSLICIDFTHPTAVNSNADFYCRHGWWFVMVTDVDRETLATSVTGSSVSAVIAPNMAKQIVGLQAMFEYAATTFPGLFDGYRLEVRESHQQGKADTSGTARAIVAAFNRLGVAFHPDQIQMERDPSRQEHVWGIPAAHLGGHGWHTYTLTAPDGNATLEWRHNINGRDIYIHGTFDAVRFLNRQRFAGGGGSVFSMIDVLREGPVPRPPADQPS